MAPLTREAVERLMAGPAPARLNGRDLRGCDLSGLALVGADLSYALIETASLTGASLREAILWSARAQGARFDRCDLRAAKLATCDCFGATFREADLTGADLTGANLARADLAGARLDGARLVNTILVGIASDSQTRWPVGFAPPTSASERVLTEADAGQAVEVPVGSLVLVRLPERVSDGREWQIASEGLVPTTGPVLLGSRRDPAAGDVRELTFGALSPGSARLGLVLGVPGGSDRDAAARVSFNIKIGPRR